MTTKSESQKSHVTPDNLATLVCPKCNAAQTISVANFKNKKHELRVKCKCGYVYRLQLEFRRYHRKHTKLDGTYEPTTGKSGGIVKILNLSIGGARFEVRGVHDIKPGQKGSLVFTLDDRNATVLAKDVTIRSVEGKEIGCEFADNQAYHKDLGFYLRS
jgi:Zn ribbon nucleic-acid-binding protein